MSCDFSVKLADLVTSQDGCGVYTFSISGPDAEYFTVIDNELHMTTNPGVGVYEVTIYLTDVLERFEPLTQQHSVKIHQCDKINAIYSWNTFNTDSDADAFSRDRRVAPFDVPAIIGEFPLNDVSEVATQVSVGITHCGIIDYNGNIRLWGDNTYGQLGISRSIIPGSTSDAQNPLPNRKFKQISCGYLYTAVIGDDNSLWLSGRNDFGQVAIGSVGGYRDYFTLNTGYIQAKYVHAGTQTTLVIATDGTLWGCGKNNVVDILNTGSLENVDRMVQINTDTDWKKAVSSTDYCAAIKEDGSLYTWGVNTNGQLGDGTTDNRSTLQKIGSDSWKDIYVRSNGLYAIKDDGSIWHTGQLCFSDSSNVLTLLNDGRFIKLSLDGSSSTLFALDHQFRLYKRLLCSEPSLTIFDENNRFIDFDYTALFGLGIVEV